MRVTDPAAAAAAGTLALTANDDQQLLASVRRALATEYDVERELGRGGMAVVFKARDKDLDRPVALKVLPPELAPVATVADRFKREARLAASLDHPNIIPVYRVAQTGGVLYMAMKFIDGKSLDALVAENGALPLPVILTVLRAAARALAHAHEHGIVHRDIKGANILIDRDGRVVVSDFGIARAVESSTLTATGVMIGTPHFMSPEQCAGKPVGPQSDQYSLGVVAYQLLTGSVPFDGDSLPEILQHHWFTPPPDIAVARPETPAALTAAVQRLLAKDPAQRFASTSDLVAALESIPFPATERAAGEARLRALVAPKGTPPAVTAPPKDAAGPAARQAGAPPAPAGAAAPPAKQPPPASARPAVRPAAPTKPLAAAHETNVAAAPATREAAAAPVAARRKPPVPTRPARPARRWSKAVVLLLLLLVVGAGGIAVKARGNGLPRLSRTATPAIPDRLNANEMREAGTSAYRAGYYELARRFFVRAVAVDSDNAELQQQLGCTLLKLGRADSARAHWSPAGSKGGCGNS